MGIPGGVVCHTKAISAVVSAFNTLPPPLMVRVCSARNKWLALPDKRRHTRFMNATVLEPKKLRPELIQRVEAMDDESLLVLHRALLIVEKERLWRELSAEAEQDRRSGKYDRLPEIIRQARTELRQE